MIESKTNFKVYTEEPIAREICNKTMEYFWEKQKPEEKLKSFKLADLACGDGNLLVKALVYLLELTKKIDGKIHYNEEWIEGYDIDSDALNECQKRCQEILISYGIEGKKIRLFNRNSLFQDLDKKYDIILGNPPYFGEKNNKEIFEVMKKSPLGEKYYEGRMDYFYFFIEKGIDSLKKDGLLTYVTTNYWLKADHAKLLREKIKSETEFKYIHNYNCTLFKEALGQHNIVFTLKKRKGNSIIECIQEDKYFKISNKKIYNYRDKIILAERKKLEELKKLFKKRTHFLDELLNINQGIVSGYDKAFVFDSSFKNFKEYLQPFYKNSDINSYKSKKNSHWILYLDKYKKPSKELLEYLEKYREKLEKRREVLTNKINWWELQWARKEKIFLEPKIIGRQRAPRNIFTYSEEKYYGSADIYYLTSKKTDINLYYILGYLNSSLFYDWFLYNGKTKGKCLELYATPLKETPIYYSSSLEEIEYIEKLVKKQLKEFSEKIQEKIDSFFKEKLK